MTIWIFISGLLFSLTFLHGYVSSSSNGTYNEERQLYHVLFDDYLSSVRPVKNSNHIVQVDVKFELSHIKLEDIGQVMHTVGFFAASWEDEYLKWDPQAYSGIEHLIIPASDVWLPDFAMMNSADAFYDSTFVDDFRVKIVSNGTVYWSFGGIITTSCALDLTSYPFDQQECDISLENWAYSGNQVDLEISHTEVVLDSYQLNGEWTLDRTKVTKQDVYYDTFPNDPYPSVTFKLQLTRKSGYYVINILLPCFLVAVLNISVFLLPAASGEKIGLSITILLAYTVFMLIVAEHTPKNSDFTPILTMFIAGITGMSAVSVLVSVWVLYMSEHAGSRRVPYFLRVVCFKYLARVYCMRSSVPEMDKVGHSKEKGKADKTDIENISAQNLKEQLQNSFLPGNSIEDILAHLTFLTDRFKEQDAGDEIKEEWHAVARILDRTFFFLFLITAIIFTTVMFA